MVQNHQKWKNCKEKKPQKDKIDKNRRKTAKDRQKEEQNHDKSRKDCKRKSPKICKYGHWKEIFKK